MGLLFEDNHTLVVDKPSGMPSQKDESGDLDLLTFWKDDIKKRHQKPGQVFLGLVHRLDRPASGCMLLARTSKGAARYSKQMRENAIQKVYLAICHGPVPERGTFEDWLQKKGRHVEVVDKKEGQFSRLHFNRLGQNHMNSLVAVRLETGRPHQIRVQFASRGFSLSGDGRYGDSVGRTSQLALRSLMLEFQHATQAKRMMVLAPDVPIFSEPFSTQVRQFRDQLIEDFSGQNVADGVYEKTI